jgi:catechol 2,3-dioxygenase-like lactoylglutathione lyase family enzyme
LLLYVTLGVADIARAARFYDAVMATLGAGRSPDSVDDFIGYGPGCDGGVSLWLCRPWDAGAPSPGNGAMTALRAPSAAAVRAVHAAALAQGGSDEGAPGTRPYYSPSFYVAYVRDPDGNKLACAFHRHDPANPG